MASLNYWAKFFFSIANLMKLFFQNIYTNRMIIYVQIIYF